MEIVQQKILPKPNVLIVGSARAGTTALYTMLCEHPNVDSPKRKEPKYFSYLAGINNLSGPEDDKTINRSIKNDDDYIDIFSKDEKLLSIDGSVDNLYYHDKVIPLIKKKLKDVKIIICLRNPVFRAFSAYNMQVRDLRETKTFKEALEIENDRIKNNFEFIWHYKHCGLYYQQVKAYLDNFSKVKVVIAEDFLMRPEDIYGELLEFLELKDFSNINFNLVSNESSIPKNKFLHKKLILSNVVRKISSFIPLKLRKNIHFRIIRKIIGYEERQYDGDQLKELHDFFITDIKLLSNLLNKDLENLWMDQFKIKKE